jgi:predicted TIM-barrel fold metal-dependent hydrolase
LTRSPAGARTVVDARVRLPAELRPHAVEPAGLLDRYDAVLDLRSKSTRTLKELRSEMDQVGVSRAVVHAECEYPVPTAELNEAVAELVTGDDRFAGVGTITMPPELPSRALTEIRHVASIGLIGLNIQPAFFNTDMDDRLLYPVYATAEELELTVCLHTGVNYSPRHRMDHEAPGRLDRVAADFPNLRIVACHAGWPFVMEMVAIARRHSNVYLEFGGLAPKYVDAPDAGWPVLRRMMGNLLKEQVLFATDWPVMSLERCVAEWDDMSLSEDTLEHLYSLNVARAFRLDGVR